MILNEFSKVLKQNEKELLEGKSSLKILMEWIIEILSKKPRNNIEKIIHTEIALCQNNVGDFLLVAKSKSGQVLTNSLYEFTKSFDNHILRNWLRDKNANDFNNKFKPTTS